MNRQSYRSRSPRQMWVAALAIVGLALSVAVLSVGVVDAAPSVGCRASVGDVVVYRPPVDARIVDGFRLENGRYGAGNRGLEYRPGQSLPVGAMADGQVVFAGPVAGQLHVTLCHADGRRSSYSYLQSVAVRVGNRVAAGATVGLAGERLHVGVREGREYVDPEPLLTRGEPRVHLVVDTSFGRSGRPVRPVDARAGSGEARLRALIDQPVLRAALRSTVGLGRPLR